MEEPGRLTKSQTRLSLSLLTWQSPRLKGGAEAIKGRSQAVGTPLSQSMVGENTSRVPWTQAATSPESSEVQPAGSDSGPQQGRFSRLHPGPH